MTFFRIFWTGSEKLVDLGMKVINKIQSTTEYCIPEVKNINECALRIIELIPSGALLKCSASKVVPLT